MKNPPTLAGIETATSRFVAQQLNHCATAVLQKNKNKIKKIKRNQKLSMSVGELLALLCLDTAPYERIFITADVPGRIVKFSFINVCFVPKYFCSQTRPSFSDHKAK